MIRLIVVDDQTLVRQGICSLLELTSDIRMVAEARDGAEAIRLIPSVEVEVVLVDVRMPGQGGIEVLRALAGRLPPTIPLTTFGYSNREIAGALGTAEGTVKNHTSSILSKLGVRDRTRAVLRALDLGFL